MTWTDTGRVWVSPSPNLRSAEAAIAYPGVALLEATNVSEGRGTEQPFLRLGAPWLEGFELETTTPGFALEPVRFTPRASPAAPWAKFLDEECVGWGVTVTNPAAAEPYRLGLELVAALSRHPRFQWRREGEALTWLLGSDRPGRLLASGAPVADILAADEGAHRQWSAAVKSFLLYGDG